ncbi:MAG: hypothetical protein BM564_02585 [Bacteroidetes bacterium MedPE-SWsnd-G2]|nr:MAG: hypothetical protein BM564_02585 [Bacteroidetes bacterium MedPE-SWsnd-G2]
MSFGQLSVRNSEYIFITDEIIFVEDFIHISESTSSIYLRDDAQIIQGSGSTGNSGIGFLSVQQYGDVNPYAYNYWCSPIGNADSDTSTNENFRVNLIDDAIGVITSNDASFTNNHNGISSPLTISKTWLYTFEAQSSYSGWNYVGEAGNISPGLGFTMKGTDHPTFEQLYEFRGKPNNGTISNTILNNQLTLIGNPYPSVLDARTFIWDTENKSIITGTLYYWEQKNGNSHNLNSYEGGYATYTISEDGLLESSVPATFITYNGDGTPTNIPVGNGIKSPTRYIPIGQGFMVEGKADGVVKTKNDQRTYVKNNAFSLRTTSESNAVNIEGPELTDEGFVLVPAPYQRFRINVDFNDTYTRQLMMNFHPSATDEFDYGLETTSPDILASDAYWLVNTDECNTQALAFDLDLHIPLIVQVNSTQSINFRPCDIQNFDDTQGLFLHDKETGIYTNLREQDYTILMDSGLYANRFEIVFEVPTLGIPDGTDKVFNIYQNNNEGKLVIENPKNIDVSEITLYDIQGRQVVTPYSPSVIQSEYTIDTNSLQDGVYIALIKSIDNVSSSQKVIIKNEN